MAELSDFKLKNTELETRLETLDELKDKASYLEGEKERLTKDVTFLTTKLSAAEEYFEKRSLEQRQLEEAFLQKAKALKYGMWKARST